MTIMTLLMMMLIIIVYTIRHLWESSHHSCDGSACLSGVHIWTFLSLSSLWSKIRCHHQFHWHCHHVTLKSNHKCRCSHRQPVSGNHHRPCCSAKNIWEQEGDFRNRHFSKEIVNMIFFSNLAPETALQIFWHSWATITWGAMQMAQNYIWTCHVQ